MHLNKYLINISNLLYCVILDLSRPGLWASNETKERRSNYSAETGLHLTIEFYITI